ncbi:MAG: hypothetical protein ACOYOK_15500 [Pseudobdellovibrionaceae bacterium]
MILKKIIFSLALVLVHISAYAGEQIDLSHLDYSKQLCSNLFSEQHSLSQSIESKSKTKKDNLDFAQRDPHGFFLDVENRFMLQKKNTPDRPYGFEIPEIAPAVDFMISILQNRKNEYGYGENVVWRKKDQSWLKIFKKTKNDKLILSLYKKYRAERQFINDLLQDLQAIKENKFPYDQIIKSAFYTSKVLAITADRNLPWKSFILDQVQNAKIASIAEEYENYKSEKKILSPIKNRFNKNYIFTQNEEIFDPNKLQMILIPFSGNITAHDFLKLRSTPIYIIGLTDGLFKADGWKFNEHQVLVHDVYYHAGMMNLGGKEFLKAYDLNSNQIEKLRAKQKEWYDLFKQEIKKISNPALKNAILDVALTIVHDRGPQWYPNTFIEWADNYKKYFNSLTLSRIYLYLNRQMHILRISENLIENVKYTDMAVLWLADFWSQELIVNDPVYKFVESKRKPGLNPVKDYSAFVK